MAPALHREETPLLRKSVQPTSINPIWLLLWSLGLRRVVGLLISVIWREVRGGRAPPAVPDTGESLWVGDPPLEGGAASQSRLRGWEVVKLFLVLQTIAIILLVTTTRPFLSCMQRDARTVPWHRCWSRSIILPQACKFREKDDSASAKWLILNMHFNLEN